MSGTRRTSQASCWTLCTLPTHVSTEENFKFLGSTISQNLERSNIVYTIKKAHWRMCFLHQFRGFNLPQVLLIQFCYQCCYPVCSPFIPTGTKRQQKTVKMIETTTTTSLSSTQHLQICIVSEWERKHDHRPFTSWSKWPDGSGGLRCNWHPDETLLFHIENFFFSNIFLSQLIFSLKTDKM